jgi:serine/threonine protein kinase
MPDESVLLGQLAEEFAPRVREGGLPDVEEYARRDPELAARIHTLFPTLMFLEAVAGGGVPADAEAVNRLGRSAAELPPGLVFGNYRMERKVGQGGMGTVYEAAHLPLDKRVALKVLRWFGEFGTSHLERFFREVKTAAGLHYTNIVPVFDISQVAGTSYYARQLIDGMGLDQIFRATLATKATRPPAAPGEPSGPRTGETAPSASEGRTAAPGDPPDHFRRVAQQMLQAAEALAHAHQRGVIHRDIKPSNLQLDRQGVLWVTDFGLAHRADVPSLTQPGALVGTPRYMSPEQAEAARQPVDQRTDLNSLGASLYELLTWQPAVIGQTPQEVVAHILRREPVASRGLQPKVPRGPETICLMCLRKEPSKRYASARELADDLTRFLGGKPIRARPVGAAERLGRWCRRNPRLAGLAAASMVLLAAVAVVSTVAAVRIAAARDEADHSA